MTESRGGPLATAPFINRLLSTTIVVSAAMYGGALAQQSVAAKPVDEIGGEEERVLFEADTVSRPSEAEPIVAEGNVKAYFGERYLRADKLSYDPATDIVIAEGNVSITDENLNTAFAGRVELTGDLRDGVAENFSALLAENARLAAESAVREQGARTKLRNAVYTSCSVCSDKGEGKTPTWRIKSLRVTRDEERKVVRFHHAFFEVKGVPILYAPFIQAPDPSVERQSGFLTPLVGASSRLGFNFELPYYLAISNHQDATFFPKYTSNDGILWQGEWRRRGRDSYHVLSGGIIDFANAEEDPTVAALDVPGVRWNVFAKGFHNFSNRLQVGYDIERASDDTFLRRYGIQRRGELRQELDTSRTNRLRSNVYAKWENNNTTLTADSFLFQGLRAQDDSSLTPYVLPLLDFNHVVDRPLLGGKTNINLNFASLQRTRGTDTRRLTASAFWEREHITRTGHKFNAFAELRGDIYRFEDLNEGTEFQSGIPAQDNITDGRFAPSVGVEWSYPLYNRVGSSRLFIEPRVQLVASPAGRNDSSIINEDSQSIEFDYPSLFEYNKSTGFDRFEDGQRMNVGLKASAILDNGIALEGEIGRQFRLQSTNAFSASTGLGDAQSDYVGSLNIKYRNYAGIENRFRVNDSNGSLERIESMAYLNLWRFRGNLSYVRLNEEDPSIAVGRREELNGRISFKMSDHWSAGLGWREDLTPSLNSTSNGTIRQDFILAYQDDCALFEITYRNDQTQQGVDVPTDNAILFRFTLRSLVD